MIEAEAVGFWVDDLEEAGFERDELRGIHLALENGGLDSLAVVEARLGSTPQAGFPGGSRGGDIVSDEDIHGFEIWDFGLFCQKCWIGIEVSAEVAG
jgi:hypothetical protein